VIFDYFNSKHIISQLDSIYKEWNMFQNILSILTKYSFEKGDSNPKYHTITVLLRRYSW